MSANSLVAGYSARLHRRPAYAVNSPAILCHRCYLFTDDRTPPGQPAHARTRRDKIVALNEFLRAVQTAGRGKNDTSRVQLFRRPDIAGAAQGTDDASHAEIDNVGLQETVLANLHILDDSDAWSGWRARIRVDVHVEYYSVTFILDRRDLQTVLKRTPETLPTDPALCRAYVSRWYRTIWEEEFFPLLKGEGVSFNFLNMRQFFECRGLVLDTASTGAADPQRDYTPILDERISNTKRNDARTALKRWIDTNRDVMSRILRLDRSAQKDQDANCVLSFVENGRGVYASSMGRSEAELRSKGQEASAATPERYLLLHHGLPRFQVGRSLRRFHVLDELRCASTFNLSELLDTSRRIRTLGDEIDSKLHHGAEGLTRRSLKAMQDELNALTSDRRIGGLLYRINRSRYYVRNFKLGMEDMRFAPIRGWEPYDAFMHRNLFPTIDHIDAIGQRFEALASRVGRLTEERDVTESINVQNRIADIQEIGEIIGWTAAAYYAGQILSKALHVLPHNCAFCNVAWTDICHAVHWLTPDFAGMLISCPLALSMYRHYKRKRETRSGEAQ
jgi:Protein of unknown function (DUF3422)